MIARSIICLIALSCFSSTLVAKSRTEQIGDTLQFALPLSALIYSTAISDYEGDKQLFYSFASTFAATQILKHTIREERPYEDEGVKGTTFPSGHTSAAFSGAAYIQMRYGWTFGLPSYLLAGYTGYSRVHADKHNILDVMFAAAMAIGISYFFVDNYYDDSKININAGLNNNSFTVNLSLKF